MEEMNDERYDNESIQQVDENSEDNRNEEVYVHNPIGIYEHLKNETGWLVGDVEYFKDFLIAASIIDKASGEFNIDNKVLIYSQNIDARYLYKREVWEEMGYTINEDEWPILILKGEKGTDIENYIVEELYDISQTNAQYPEEPRYLFNDLGEAAEGILRVKPCEIVFSVIAPANRFAYYNYGENKISVTNGCKSYDSLFSDVACEYAHYEFARIKNEKHLEKAERDGREAKPYKYQRKTYLFHAECAAYALSMMYGVNPGNYNMLQVHQSWVGMPTEKVREELEMILEAIRCIDDRLQFLLAEEREA